MEPGDKVLIRARKCDTNEPVLVERVIKKVVDAQTVEYQYGAHFSDVIAAKYGTGLGCWCLPTDDPTAHAEKQKGACQ